MGVVHWALCLTLEEGPVEALEGPFTDFIPCEMHSHKTHVDHCLAHVALATLACRAIQLAAGEFWQVLPEGLMRSQVRHIELSSVVDARQLRKTLHGWIKNGLVVEKFNNLLRFLLVAFRNFVFRCLIGAQKFHDAIKVFVIGEVLEGNFEANTLNVG